MAEDDAEKNLDPSPHKIEKEKKKGNVVKSQEIVNWFMISGFLLITLLAAPFCYQAILFLRTFLQDSHTIAIDAQSTTIITKKIASWFLSTLAPVMIISIVMAITSHIVQNRPRITYDKIKIKISKISPNAGIKRLFSKQGIVQFVAGLLKITIITIIIAVLLWLKRNSLDAMTNMDTISMLIILKQQIVIILLCVLGAMSVIIVLDYTYQYNKWHKAVRMTHQEKRDENKELEGDPKIRSRLRDIRNRNHQNNLITKVKQASVVITNPTHFAIALDYKTGMEAPVCIAKGKNHIAVRMRKIARENNIPIVENPPLARLLYQEVKIEHPIQPAHYQAVAGIISTVIGLDAKKL